MAILGDKNSSLAFRDVGLTEWWKTCGLPGWLEIATNGLEAAAKQRIAQEIEAHFAEAISDHLRAGESEPSAQEMALKELGDPQVAARNFQKSHLTESDGKAIRWMEWSAAKPFFSFGMLDAIPLAGFALLWLRGRQTPYVRIAAIFLLVTYVGCRLIPRLLYTMRLSRTSFIKGVTLSAFLTDTACGICLAMFFYTLCQNIYVSGFFGLFNVLLPNLKSSSSLRIWNKLRKS
ncbi:MAG TPA: permease prefix domain 1-containing protein [Verrucomicrobiae bacterium]|jgi:hypothetical protein|nr:permease prefix domain 1-containing protein [Verrucomicrobiae bacterium]